MGKEKQRPRHWAEKVSDLKGIDSRKVTRAFEWGCEWISYWLSRWAFLDVLEYVGKLGILVAAIAYIYPGCNERKQAADDSRKSKHYVAWQTLNSAAGKAGDAGRSDALQDLNRDGVSLDSISLAGGGAVLANMTLTNAQMRFADLSGNLYAQDDFSGAHFFYSKWGGLECQNCSFRGADFSSCVFTNASFQNCDFSSLTTSGSQTNTSFRDALFSGSPENSSQFTGCSFTGADLSGSRWSKAIFYRCNFAGANLSGIILEGTSNVVYACNLFGASNASPEFVAWAYQQSFVVTNITSLEKWRAWSPPASFMPYTSPQFFAWASNQWAAYMHTNNPQAWLAWSRSNLPQSLNVIHPL